MNIVTTYPTSMPMTPVNPFTEQARRENMQRELIEQPSKSGASGQEKAVGSDAERAKRNADTSNPTYDFSGADVNGNETVDAIEGRSSGEGQQGQDANEEETKQQQAKQQADEQEQKDEQKIDELKARDTEVRVHEQAHAAAGGQYAGAPQYGFETGPDGKRYAVDGEVSIDTSVIPDDPQATIAKMDVVRAAALAPAEPSAQDLKVAAEATQTQNSARADLAKGSGEASKSESTQFNVKADDKSDVDYSTALPEHNEKIASRVNVIQGFYAAAVEPHTARGGVYA